MNSPSRLPKVENSLAGNLIVSAPQMPDMAMHHGVVLILGESNEGTQGVLLNSPLNEAMRNWCRQTTAPVDQQQVVEQIQAIAQSAGAEINAQEVPVTICMAENPAKFEEQGLLDVGHGVRILLGRITWKPGELESQLRSGAWMSLPAMKDLVFGDHENLWGTCVKRIGELVIAELPGVESFPEDISAN